MQKSILTYITIFIIIVIVAAALYQHYTSTSASTSSTTLNSTSTTTLASHGTSTAEPVSLSTSTIKYSSCISPNAIEPIPGGNFSSGTYTSWNATGAGFGTVPFNLTYANEYGEYYAAPWSGYSGGYAATTYSRGLSVSPGNLTSSQFTVTEPYLDFKLISSQSSLLYVQVLSNGVPVITTHYNTYVSPTGVANAASTFVNASIPIASLLCKNVSIKVVAGITGSSASGKNYIAVTGFYTGSEPGNDVTQPVNQTINST